MFSEAYAFNQPIDSWNTGSATSFNSMFNEAYSFNQPIGWGNQPIGGWNTVGSQSVNEQMTAYKPDGSRVNFSLPAPAASMEGMFYNATAFNQPIGEWKNTSAATSFHEMFNGASAFNQPIGEWITDAVTSCEEMFREATAFNQPIGNWTVLGLP